MQFKIAPMPSVWQNPSPVCAYTMPVIKLLATASPSRRSPAVIRAKRYDKISAAPFVPTPFGLRLLRQAETERLHDHTLLNRLFAAAGQMPGQRMQTRVFRSVCRHLVDHLGTAAPAQGASSAERGLLHGPFAARVLPARKPSQPHASPGRDAPPSSCGPRPPARTVRPCPPV